MKRIKNGLLYLTALLYSISCADTVQAAEIDELGLRIGWAMEDVTPIGETMLYGQYYNRKATFVQSPLKVTALALESVGELGQTEQAIMVSFDLINIPRAVQDSLKALVKDQIPDFNVRKLFVGATHTHSGPKATVDGDYGRLLLQKGSAAIIAAWKNRKPGGISRGIGYAVVGHSRRVAYADGTTEMYGATTREDFIGMEGPSDPSVDMLFCWDMNKKLTGVVMNVSCPAQVTESKYYVSADYWSEVRKQLQQRFPEGVFILPQLGAAGDISPRDLPTNYKAGEPNMWDVPGIVEIGKRLAFAFDEVYEKAKNDIRTQVVFKHEVKDVDIPVSRVTDEGYSKALALITAIRAKEPKDPNDAQTAWNRFLSEIAANEKVKEFGPWDNKESDFGRLRPAENIVEKFKNPGEPFYNIELHSIRLGDVAFANNPFELYVNYGFQITAKSKAKQVFVVQLSGDSGGYLPTAVALSRGGYSAQVTRVGPTGGQVLVNETVKMINSFFE